MGWLGKPFRRENADVDTDRDRDGGDSVPGDRPASAGKGYPAELRERAVRMVFEHAHEHRRLLGPIGFVPPSDCEASYYQQVSVA